MSRSVRFRLAALAVGPALLFAAGCGKASEKAAEKIAERAIEDQLGGNADVDYGPDGSARIETADGIYETDGEGNVRIETADGTVTGGVGVPEGWPEDVPIPDGIDVQYGAASSDGASIAGNSTGSPAEVVDAFTGALSGWEVEPGSVVDSGDGAMRAASFSDGERSLVISAMASDDGTSVSIVYQPAGG